MRLSPLPAPARYQCSQASAFLAAGPPRLAAVVAEAVVVLLLIPIPFLILIPFRILTPFLILIPFRILIPLLILILIPLLHRLLLRAPAISKRPNTTLRSASAW